MQGPVGPFFKTLRNFLEENGVDTWRISFNAGDRLFSDSKKRITFRGDENEWAIWFRSFLSVADVDHVILFGAERPIHEIARQQAKKFGVNVIALEEGYVRPGFITVERDANNWLSPIAGQLPPETFDDDDPSSQVRTDFRGFRAMCRYGAAYYGARTLFTGFAQRDLFHRRVRPVSELVAWTRNLYRRAAHASSNFATIEKLLEHHDRRYFLVPLQVATDTQSGRAARGWTSARLVMDALRSFARSAPPSHRLVFKIHPLERGHSQDGQLAVQTAQMLGIEHRVDVVDFGSLGLLTRHAAGMITVNSTSGLSALFHGVPLLVVGDAIYANDTLATCARGNPDFDSFWTLNHVADQQLRRQYLSWIRHKCLKPGDFYARDGMRTACLGVLEAINSESMGHVATATPQCVKKSAC